MLFLQTYINIGYEMGNCYVYLWCNKKQESGVPIPTDFSAPK